MTEYKVGDTVTFRKNGMVYGPVVLIDSGAPKHSVWVPGLAGEAATVEIVESFGWQVVEHVPAVTLPAEPGWYVDKDQRPWYIDPSELPPRLRCARHSGWCGDSETPEQWTPFTRLRPVDEVRAVIDYLNTGFMNLADWDELVAAAKRHFGVTP